MCIPLRWSRVAVLSSALLTVSVVTACATRRARDARLDDLDRTSMVRGQACDRADQDTTHYLHLPLYRACAVTLGARRVATDVRPEFWPTGRDRNCFSALVHLAVDTLGRPEPRTARLVRASDPGYGAAVLAIIPTLRFEPAWLGGRRVRQLYELREVLLVRRSRLDAAGGARPAGASRSMQAGSQGLPSGAPTGADLPITSGVGAC